MTSVFRHKSAAAPTMRRPSECVTCCMTTTRHFLTAILATGAVALVAPGIAGASSICVDAPLGTQCNDVEPDLQAALNAAETNDNGADTILLGDPGHSLQGPFKYPALPTFLLDPVTVKGVGFGRPHLTAPAGQDVFQGQQLTLDHLDVSLPSSNGGIGVHVGASASLHDVHVTGPGGGGLAEGIRSEGGVLALDDVQASGTGRAGVRLMDGTVTATGVRTSDATFGVISGDTAQLTLSHSKISGRNIALATRGTTSVAASVLETTAPDGRGVGGGDGSVSLDHVSVVHRGPVDGNDAALNFHPVDVGGQATIKSVVLAGYTRGFSRDTSDNNFNFPITVRDSVWDPSHDVFVSAPNPGAFTEQGNAHVDPKLVDIAGGDYRLRGSSAAVDRDTQTDAGYKDVDGAGLVDGDANGVARADAGALEYRREAPSIDAADVPAAGVTGQALAVSAIGSDADGDALQFAWDFGDGAIGSGAQATHAFASAGIHTIVLHVTDEGGVTTTRSFSVAVSAAAASGTTGSGGIAKDVLAPKLSNVRLSKDRRRLLFTISERAKVRVTVGRSTVSKTVDAGRRSISLVKALKRVHRARVAVKITATDAAGNRAAPRTLRVRVARS
jgi:PKD domain